MLESNKNKFFETIFSVYNRNLLKRRFNSISVSGLDFLIKQNTNIPLIIYCNHSSWWDGLVVFQISYFAHLNSFLMMEEKNLKRFFLFRKLGAFSVNRENPRLALESIHYAVKLLKSETDSTLWIFPQGEILNNDLRPILFYNGLSKIIEKTDQCYTTSLSIRYEFLVDFKPDIFVKIAKPELINNSLIIDTKNLTKGFEKKMTKNLNELKSDIINNETNNYSSII